MKDTTLPLPSSVEDWDLIIEPKAGIFDFHLSDLWRYRDLIVLFVKRDFTAYYKQTILGPLWYVIQPVFTTVVFTIVFGKFGKLPTDGIPQFLFYLSGNIVWAYFSTCLTGTSNTFLANAGVFGKVYFPRLTVPISVVITNLFQFGIQFALFLSFFAYFYLSGSDLHPSLWVLLLPLLLLQMALLGLGVGIIISSLTTKYRDLAFVMTFGVQLWMYATPVVYPLSRVPVEFKQWYILNPMVSVLESFRLIFFGASALEPVHVVISIVVTLLVVLLGLFLFNRVEKSFMDTV